MLMRALEVPPLEVDAIADVEQLGPGLLHAPSTSSTASGLSCFCHRVVEGGPLLAVENRVVDEVVRRVGLVGRDDLLEGLAAHRLEGVVELLLLADRRDRLLREGLAAQAAGPVGRVDERGIGQLHELV